jgi:ATP-dependent helicase/nuclease subunit B
LLKGASEDEARLLKRLDAARGALRRSRATLAKWLRQVLASLASLGAVARLNADAAGRELTDLLTRLQGELAHSSAPYALGEWRQWLSEQMEEATFRDSSIQSSVVLTHLGVTQLRRFDAVVLMGADAAHLPVREEGALFNEAVRLELGLPARAQSRRLEQQRLAALMSAAPAMLITWQRLHDGEANALSAHFARLQVFHEIAYGDDLAERELLAAAQAAEEPRSDALFVRQPPRPAAPRLLPATVSASSYGSLLACPYQFYARYLLGLAPREEVSEVLEKKDYGELVHALLRLFHGRTARVSDLSDEEAERRLHEATAEAFAAAHRFDYAALAWRLRWEAKIPSYLDWQREREAAGWLWHAGEEERRRDIGKVAVKGRIDRIDRRIDDEGTAGYAVIDYKTQAIAGLRKRVEAPGEDAQLPVYALLLDHVVQQGMYLALDEEPTRSMSPKADMTDLAALNRARINALFSRLAEGAPLPAQGVTTVCERCEVRGLCRRAHWQDTEQSG